MKTDREKLKLNKNTELKKSDSNRIPNVSILLFICLLFFFRGRGVGGIVWWFIIRSKVDREIGYFIIIRIIYNIYLAN